MKLFNRIISSALAIAIVICAMPAAFADFSSNDDEQGIIGNLWDSYLALGVRATTDVNPPFMGILKKLIACGSENVCALSSNGYHHSDTYDSIDHDENGYYLNCTCSDCHQHFVIRSSELPASYDEHVEELPVNGVTNTGSFVWHVTCKDIDYTQNCYFCFSDNNKCRLNLNQSPTFEYTDYGWTASLIDLNDAIGFNVVPCYGASSINLYASKYSRFQAQVYFVYPVSGDYRLKSCAWFEGNYTDTYRKTFHVETVCSGGSSWNVCYSGRSDRFYLNENQPNDSAVSLLRLVSTLHLPVYEVYPDVSALVGHEHDYDPDTRPGDIIQIDNVTIVDETNNYFTDPVTKEPQPIENWTYDYSDRSYHVTTNEGDNYTVTYGDENVTIKHGDTINEYNYYITQEPDPGPGPSPDDPEHTHTYTSTTTKAATCTEPGSIKYTCSGCGHTYTESVPALGHDWIVSESTEDEYSFPKGVTCPNGAGHALTYTLNKDDRTYHVTCSDCGKEFDVDADVKFGHKVYTCPRCGETYEESNKDSGGLFSAIGDLLADGIRWIVDKLKQLVEAFQGIGEIFNSFMERLEESAGGYPDFFRQVIAIMPEDLMTVIWFAIIAAFAVAAWRKWFG